jgi:hypothetical protein
MKLVNRRLSFDLETPTSGRQIVTPLLRNYIDPARSALMCPHHFQALSLLPLNPVYSLLEPIYPYIPLHVRKQPKDQRKNICEILYYAVKIEIAETRQIWLKYGENSGHFTYAFYLPLKHKVLHIY